jgi:hypothetical protein
MTSRRVPCINPNDGKPRRADPTVIWQVPRDMRFVLPTGMSYLAAGRVVLLRPGRPGQSLSPEDWGQGVAVQVTAVLLVSALHAHFVTEGGCPNNGRVYTRKPRVVHLRAGQRITVTPAASMTGELHAFPLRQEATAAQPAPRHD